MAVEVMKRPPAVRISESESERVAPQINSNLQPFGYHVTRKMFVFNAALVLLRA